MTPRAELERRLRPSQTLTYTTHRVRSRAHASRTAVAESSVGLSALMFAPRASIVIEHCRSSTAVRALPSIAALECSSSLPCSRRTSRISGSIDRLHPRGRVERDTRRGCCVPERVPEPTLARRCPARATASDPLPCSRGSSRREDAMLELTRAHGLARRCSPPATTGLGAGSRRTTGARHETTSSRDAGRRPRWEHSAGPWRVRGLRIRNPSPGTITVRPALGRAAACPKGTSGGAWARAPKSPRRTR